VTITRRKLLIGTAAGAGVLGLAGLGAHGARELIPRLRAIATPSLPTGTPGPLPPDDRRVLRAAAAALIHHSPGASHPSAGAPSDEQLSASERMLESRARNLPGYRELYGRFVRALEARGAALTPRDASSTSFAALSVAHRREILADLCPPGRLARLRTGLTDPDRTRFRLYVVREILDLYAATGAWLVLGFGPPPGLPRGLAAYTRAPEEAAR